MTKEYIRPDGYKIRASEKAYNLLYRKNGFMPVETAASIGETTAINIIPVKGTVEPTGGAGRANKGKGKANSSKPEKNTVTKNIPKQEENSEDATDIDAADQDAAELPEGE